MNASGLAEVCDLLNAIQSTDTSIRKGAESRLEQAASDRPDLLVQGFAAVLATAADASQQALVPEELRQQAAVLLRQCVCGSGSRRPIWGELQSATQEGLKAQLLVTLREDASQLVRKNAGSTAASIAEVLAEDFDELQREWPQILQVISSLVEPSVAPTIRIVALGILKEMADIIGDGLFASGPQARAMLEQCIQDSEASVRAAGCQLVLQFAEDLDISLHFATISSLLPMIVSAMQGFAESLTQEDNLKETLEALISAIDEEPGFFKGEHLVGLWNTLVVMCRNQSWEDSDIRHSAMEALMSLATGLAEDFCRPDGRALLEQLISLNVEWMLEVEEDLDAWDAKADVEDGDEELDGEAVQLGEENLDRLAEEIAEKKHLEDVFLPMLFKVLRALQQSPSTTWKHSRSAVMAVAQVLEYIEEESWIDQCVEFIVPFVSHAHPRVRYAALHAVGQAAYDHEPYVQETHHEALLPPVVQALDDANARVASNAASAFTNLGEELEQEVIETYLNDLMTKLYMRLSEARSRVMQENCLQAIAVVAEVGEELFEPYYPEVMPVLKSIAEKASGEKERKLRGKAFECISLVGTSVGKETFAADAHSTMAAMVQVAKAGFASDDPLKEFVFEAAGRIACVLQEDFRMYLPSLLPEVVKVLQHRPQELDTDVDLDDDEKEDMSFVCVDDKVLGLKTAVMEEMKEALSFITTLATALGSAYSEYLTMTTRPMADLLGATLPADLQQKLFKAWEVIAECARICSEEGKCDSQFVRLLVGEFLRTTVASMKSAQDRCNLKRTMDEASLTSLQTLAEGISDVIRKVGVGILTRDDISQISAVLVGTLGQLKVGQADNTAVAGKKRNRKDAMRLPESDEEDSDAEEGEVTKQTYRFCVADALGSLMRANRQDFESCAMPDLAALIKQWLANESCPDDRSLALYIADDAVDILGELSVPYWNEFMQAALLAVLDNSPVVRQYACSTIGNGARQQTVFAQMAPAAAQQIARVLQKYGERYKRRRAASKEAKDCALAVDASIRALGLICEHQEANIGGDSASAWEMWLQYLPLRYDTEEGQKAHAQLLELVVKSHPVVTSPQMLPRALAIFADVYRTRFSNSVLDSEIAAALAKAGEERVGQLAASLSDKQKGKVKQMLRAGAPGAL